MGLEDDPTVSQGIDAALPKVGGAMTGTLADSNAAQVRNIRLTDMDLADQVGGATSG